jgi:tetratricopeptide (TPR) repeat protein
MSSSSDAPIDAAYSTASHNHQTGLFQWGCVGASILGAMLRDLAIVSARTGEDVELPPRDEPLFAGVAGPDFVERLLKDVRRRDVSGTADVPFRHAALAFALIANQSVDAIPFLEIVIRRARELGNHDAAETFARLGLKEFGSLAAPELLSLCHHCIAVALYERREFQHAAEAALTAADYSRSAGDLREELTARTVAIACHYFLRSHLKSLELTFRTEELARQLEDDQALSKSLGDRGNAHHRLGHPTEAAKAFTDALHVAERADDLLAQSNWLGNLAAIAFQNEDFDGAEQLNRRALAISLQTGNLESEQFDRNNLAQALWQQEKDHEATAMMRGAIDIAARRQDPRGNEYRQVLARMYDAMGRMRRGENVNQLTGASVPAAPPTTAPAKLPTGDKFAAYAEQRKQILSKIQSDDLLQALEMADQLISDHPDVCLGYFYRGMTLHHMNRQPEAIEAFEKSLKLEPDDMATHTNLLNCWNALQDLETPRKQYERAVENAPYDAVLRIALGKVYAGLGRYDAAVRELREAVRLRPDHYGAVMMLACTLGVQARSLLSSDWNQAWAHFEQAAEMFSTLIQMDEALRADSYLVAAEHLEAIAVTSQQVNPSFLAGMPPRELLVLGQALGYFTRAILLKPESIRPREGIDRISRLVGVLAKADELIEVGPVLRDGGFVEESRMFLELATQMEPKSAKAHFELAMSFAVPSEDSEASTGLAMQYVERAIELDPNNQKYAATLHRLKNPITAADLDRLPKTRGGRR